MLHCVVLSGTMRGGFESREYKRLQSRRVARAHDLEVRHLRAFVALVDEGGVTAAARALKLSQSTVSEALSALERALGTSVVRRCRGCHDSFLTPAGQALLPHARDLLAGVETAYISVADAAVQARGAVKIVANESVSTYVLPGVLSRLRTRWPNTRFSVSVGTCAEVRRGMTEGEFDVGIVLQPIESDAASGRDRDTLQICRVLAPVVPLVIFAKPGHSLTAGKRPRQTEKRELSGFAMLLSDPSGEFHDLINAFLINGGLPTARLQSGGSVEAVKRGVASDSTSLGILPVYAIEEELRTGDFIDLNVCPRPPSMQLAALLPEGGEFHSGVPELVKELRSS